MKHLFTLIVFCLNTLFVNCFAQSTNNRDSIPYSYYSTPEEKLKQESEWLNALIISYDSIINLMATKANQELQNQTDTRYVMFMVSSLLNTKKDTAYHVIANNLATCPYIRNRNAVEVMRNKIIYPAVEAIESSSILQINIFKDYIQYSKFLNKNLSSEEIGILNFLLIRHDPAYPKLNPARYSGLAFKNAQSILDWKEE